MNNNLNKETTLKYIDCIGIDQKLHVCLPWKDKTECGIIIIKKKLNSNDYINRYSCYECTY